MDTQMWKWSLPRPVNDITDVNRHRLCVGTQTITLLGMLKVDLTKQSKLLIQGMVLRVKVLVLPQGSPPSLISPSRGWCSTSTKRCFRTAWTHNTGMPSILASWPAIPSTARPQVRSSSPRCSLSACPGSSRAPFPGKSSSVLSRTRPSITPCIRALLISSTTTSRSYGSVTMARTSPPSTTIWTCQATSMPSLAPPAKT